MPSLLRRLKGYAGELGVAVIAYCLLPNHYHLLLRQDGDEPAGRLVQRAFNSYTKALNKRYGRTGTLFEGRFKAIRVDEEGYLLHLCRYIHANPVRHGLTAHVEQWLYSNYHEWIGTRDGRLVDRDLVRGWFPEGSDYARFVSEYLRDMDALPKGMKGYVLE